jgi:hypothetical protein
MGKRRNVSKREVACDKSAVIDVRSEGRVTVKLFHCKVVLDIPHRFLETEQVPKPRHLNDEIVSKSLIVDRGRGTF